MSRTEHGVGPVAVGPGAVEERRKVPRTHRYLPLPAAWPLAALLAGFPLLWALGLGSFALPLLAVPMALGLWRRRPIRVQKGFGLWLLFLVWVVISLSGLDLRAPGTLVGDLEGRVLAAGLRLVKYLAATVTLLYVANLTERELPRRRMAALLGVFFVEVTVLGCAALVWPNGEFTSPVEMLLPASLAGDNYIQQLVHPQLAQNMSVLGFVAGRPAAPFPYTNAWGNVTSILLVWFLAWRWSAGGTRAKVVAAGVVAVAAVPIIYSLNRGVWIGLLVAVGYVAVRLALRGRVRVLAGIVAATVGFGAFVAVSPLQQVIAERLDTPHSNAGRLAQDLLAVRGTLHSPVIGYGSTRNMAGSRQSIAIGKSPECPRCGNSSTGGAGHLWLLMFAHGFVGAALYIGFFVNVLWRYRRDHTHIGLAAGTALVMSLAYLPLYGAVGMPLTLALVAVGLLWRNAAARRAGSERTAGGVPA